MRPLLDPALRRVWRDSTTLQIGLDPSYAVVLSGLGPDDAAFVRHLDGTRSIDQVLDEADSVGMSRARALHLLELLSSLLQDSRTRESALAGLPLHVRERLDADMSAVSLSGGGKTMGRRLAAIVQVCGGGRVGAGVTVLLAAAGVRHLMLDDPGVVTPADTAPAGPGLEDIGRPRVEALADAVRRVAPHAEVIRAGGERRPDLTVLCGLPHPLSRADELVQEGRAHLLVRIDEHTGLVGPLVVPGRSACLRCVESGRSDHDASWPLLAAQLHSRLATGGDTVLATLVAAQAAAQTLLHLDGRPSSAINGVLEIACASGVVRRRSWDLHPTCGCRWSG